MSRGLLALCTTLGAVHVGGHAAMRAPIARLARAAPLAASASPVDEAEHSLPPPQPSAVELRRFALPALALWMGGPALSLIDTAAIGLTAAPGAGATQLAALGPATTFCDGATYLFAFLNVATTNLYASAGAASGGTSAIERREAVVRRSAAVAIVCGLLLTTVVFIWACVRPHGRPAHPAHHLR